MVLALVALRPEQDEEEAGRREGGGRGGGREEGRRRTSSDMSVAIDRPISWYWLWLPCGPSRMKRKREGGREEGGEEGGRREEGVPRRT